MTRSLPQEQDSVAKFSLEADFNHTSYTLLSQSSDLILHPDQTRTVLLFPASYYFFFLITNLARPDLTETNRSSGGPLQTAELGSFQSAVRRTNTSFFKQT